MLFYKDNNLVTNASYKALKPSDAELLAAFPEAKQIIPACLKTYKKQRAELLRAIKAEYDQIMLVPNEDYQDFWSSWLKLTLVDDLRIVDNHIARLSRQLRIIKGQPLKAGQLTQDLINAAREVPIEDILNQTFRRSGRNLVCLCPFSDHIEKTASCHIYREENRAWCYGCNRGGDAITIAMLLHGYDFKEAVQFLAGGQR